MSPLQGLAETPVPAFNVISARALGGSVAQSCTRADQSWRIVAGDSERRELGEQTRPPVDEARIDLNEVGARLEHRLPRRP